VEDGGRDQGVADRNGHHAHLPTRHLRHRPGELQVCTHPQRQEPEKGDHEPPAEQTDIASIRQPLVFPVR